jgi:anti-sigma B factor antagonist
MKHEHSHRNGIMFIRLSGDLIGDQDNAELLNTANTAVDQKIYSCAIDLSGVRYMNSSGLGVLITLMTKFRNKSGELILVNPSEQINKLLIITKLNSIFQILKSEEEAEAFFVNKISQ